MTQAHYHVLVDWDVDGDFDAPEETLDADVIGAQWALGLAAPDDPVAAPAWAEIVLRDPAGRYAPENAAGPLYEKLGPRTLLRLTSTLDGVTRVHFTGWIETITPQPGRTVRLTCAGLAALLQRAEVFLPPGVDQTADGVIAAALAQVAYPPAISGYWLLGTARLGQDTRLPDLTVYADLEAGRARLPYVDALAGSAWDAIRAVTAVERGLCAVDRQGRVIFWNRHHLLKPGAATATLTEREADFTVETDGADLVNEATLTCHPRAVGSGPQVLWTLRTPLRLPHGQAVSLRAHFRDAAGTPLGALSLIPPVAGIDYAAFSTPGDNGLDLTGEVDVTLEAAADSARLTFTQHGLRTAYLRAGAQLRGVALVDDGPLDVTVSAGPSIVRYGRRVLRQDLPLLADPAEAARLARFLVNERGTPYGVVREVTLHGQLGPRILPLVIGLTLGDRLRLTDAASGHDGTYFLVGERHSLRRGGLEHSVTWVLRPAPRIAYWALGIPGAGELGEVTRPAI